ncbi:hypothetical protein [Mycobacterium sp.]|uniref:hypothetical protein n=1 Tax=Mycobacterium sp. TaxID=1785 RepID=UPI003C77987E
MAESMPTESGREPDTSQRRGRPKRIGSVSVDWWATVVGGVIAALAVAEALPKIPW